MEIHPFIYLSIYLIYLSIYACMYAWLDVCMHAWMYVCMYVRMYAWLHACILAILLLLEINQSWELRKIWILASSVVTSSEVKSLEATHGDDRGTLQSSRVTIPIPITPDFKVQRKWYFLCRADMLSSWKSFVWRGHSNQMLSARLLDWIVKDEEPLNIKFANATTFG